MRVHVLPLSSERKKPDSGRFASMSANIVEFFRGMRGAVHVTFERATSAPAQVLTLYYDSHANLVARGVIREPIHVAPTPRPFPGFVPDPRG